MPRMDGTGPMGQGPMTGCGRGICGGRGMGRGAGRGMGLGHSSDAADRDALNLKKELLEKGLEEVKKLLEEK